MIIKHQNLFSFFFSILFLSFYTIICTVIIVNPSFAGRLLTGPINDAHWTNNAVIVYATGFSNETEKSQSMEFAKEIEKKTLEMAKADSKIEITLISDKDFNPEKHFGKGSLYLWGPAKFHRVIKDYYKKLPFEIRNQSIYAGHHVFTGPDKGIIMLWPQPCGSEYTVIITGSSYKTLMLSDRVAHGHEDFVIFSEKSIETSSFMDFEMRGYFKKSYGKWSYSEESVVFPDNCSAFFKNLNTGFSNRVFEKFDNAPLREVHLKDGTILKDVKVFKADENRVFIISEKKGEQADVKEISLDTIKEIKGFKAVSRGIFIPEQSRRSHYLKISISDTKDSLQCVSVLKVFNDTDESMEFFDFNGSRQFSRIEDIFGNSLEFKPQKISLDIYTHRVKLKNPVKPGEDLIIRSFWTLSRGLVQPDPADDSEQLFSIAYFSQDHEELSVYVEIPKGYSVKQAIPQPNKKYSRKNKGNLLFYRLFLARLKGFYADVTIEKNKE